MNNINNIKNSEESYGRFDFMGSFKLFGGISLVTGIISLIYLAVSGLNYGIDFKGGTEIQVKFEQPVAIDQIRSSIDGLSLGEVGVQSVGGDSEYVMRFQGEQGKTDKETNELLNKAITSVKAIILEKFAAQKPDIRRVDTVGPQVGSELKRNGMLALFYSLLIILIYVAMRFDYQYSPGAVICLFHDAVLTLAIYDFVGKEMNIAIMAAVLTLIGFSLNDTIVVFDRIRETVGKYKDRGMEFVINKAVNDMLGRTFITAGSVFISALCLYIFAGGVVSDIAFILSVGIVFGIYSSVFVAAPLIVIVDRLRKPAV